MIGCAAWFAAALGAGAAGVFETTPDTRPVAIGLAAAVPLALVLHILALTSLAARRRAA